MNDDLPAFPRPPVNWTDENGHPCVTFGSTGMLLRDWMAVHVLQSLLSQKTTEVGNHGYVFPSEKEPLCRAAYNFADTLLSVQKEKKA